MRLLQIVANIIGANSVDPGQPQSDLGLHCLSKRVPKYFRWECTGSVVECLIGDPGAAGLSLTAALHCVLKQDTLILA